MDNEYIDPNKYSQGLKGQLLEIQKGFLISSHIVTYSLLFCCCNNILFRFHKDSLDLKNSVLKK
jgi:hypothetical protein